MLIESDLATNFSLLTPQPLEYEWRCSRRLAATPECDDVFHQAHPTAPLIVPEPISCRISILQQASLPALWAGFSVRGLVA